LYGCVEFAYPVSISTLSWHVVWQTPDTTADLRCGQSDTMRVWMANTNPKNVEETITSITLGGTDASEFAIVGDEYGYITDPPTSFPLEAGQRMWIDVAFRPDMTKPEPARWDDRHAKLIAANSLHTDPE